MKMKNTLFMGAISSLMLMGAHEVFAEEAKAQTMEEMQAEAEAMIAAAKSEDFIGSYRLAVRDFGLQQLMPLVRAVHDINTLEKNQDGKVLFGSSSNSVQLVDSASDAAQPILESVSQEAGDQRAANAKFILDRVAADTGIDKIGGARTAAFQVSEAGLDVDEEYLAELNAEFDSETKGMLYLNGRQGIGECSEKAEMIADAAGGLRYDLSKIQSSQDANVQNEVSKLGSLGELVANAYKGEDSEDSKIKINILASNLIFDIENDLSTMKRDISISEKTDEELKNDTDLFVSQDQNVELNQERIEKLQEYNLLAKDFSKKFDNDGTELEATHITSASAKKLVEAMKVIQAESVKLAEIVANESQNEDNLALYRERLDQFKTNFSCAADFMAIQDANRAEAKRIEEESEEKESEEATQSAASK